MTNSRQRLLTTSWRYSLLRIALSAACLLLVLPTFAVADGVVRTKFDGKLIMEDVPEIPRDIIVSLMRYQNIRAAVFRAWTADSKGIYVSTGFGNVDSIHRLDQPGGARQQLTFYNERISAVMGRPGGRELLFTRDAGGSEFAQIFEFDPDTGDAVMLTDGESRNTDAVWDRSGSRIAYQSTRRDGTFNDIWIMDPSDPESSAIALEATDGSRWLPIEFSASGRKLLAQMYTSITDSRVYLLDLDSGATELLAGGENSPSTNLPVAFDDENDGFWFITDQRGEFNRLAWQATTPHARPEYVTADIPWNVSSVTFSHDRERAAFVTNEDGMSRVYLLDPASRQYRLVDNIPTGIVFGVSFSPDDRHLGMTLNTPQSPSDAFTFELGAGPLDSGTVTRWTKSEMGGLDRSELHAPELIHYPTFDEVDGARRQIPAWVYRPAGRRRGPHPVIISIHGGPEGQARPTFNNAYQMWVNKLGAVVIRPNVRGSAGYGKTYVSLDNGFKREDAVRDIGALLDWIDMQDDLDASRIGLYGASYGGYMALASTMHFRERLKAVVNSVGITNFVTFLQTTQDYRRDLRRAEYGDERDPEMRAFLEKISPLNNVDRINIPIFIVQGQNDPRVPVTESEQMVAALREAGATVWYMNALNEGHGYRRRENRDVYQQAMMLFFREHLINGE